MSAVEFDEIQGQIEKRRGGARRNDRPFIDDQTLWMEIDLGVRRSEEVGEKPVRRRRSTVEQSALGQKERASTQRDDASSLRRAGRNPGNECAKRRQRLEHVVAGRW